MPHYRTCPACQTSYGGHVDAACALCLGEGVLVLGQKWCDQDDPEVVARAVGMYVAWIVTQKPSADRSKNLTQSRLVMARAGLIDIEIVDNVSGDHPSTAPVAPADRRRKTRKAAAVARTIGGDSTVVHMDAFRSRRTAEENT